MEGRKKCISPPYHGEDNFDRGSRQVYVVSKAPAQHALVRTSFALGARIRPARTQSVLA